MRKLLRASSLGLALMLASVAWADEAETSRSVADWEQDLATYRSDRAAEQSLIRNYERRCEGRAIRPANRVYCRDNLLVIEQRRADLATIERNIQEAERGRTAALAALPVEERSASLQAQYQRDCRRTPNTAACRQLNNERNSAKAEADRIARESGYAASSEAASSRGTGLRTGATVDRDVTFVPCRSGDDAKVSSARQACQYEIVNDSGEKFTVFRDAQGQFYRCDVTAEPSGRGRSAAFTCPAGHASRMMNIADGRPTAATDADITNARLRLQHCTVPPRSGFPPNCPPNTPGHGAAGSSGNSVADRGSSGGSGSDESQDEDSAAVPAPAPSTDDAVADAATAKAQLERDAQEEAIQEALAGAKLDDNAANRKTLADTARSREAGRSSTTELNARMKALRREADSNEIEDLASDERDRSGRRRLAGERGAGQYRAELRESHEAITGEAGRRCGFSAKLGLVNCEETQTLIDTSKTANTIGQALGSTTVSTYGQSVQNDLLTQSQQSGGVAGTKAVLNAQADVADATFYQQGAQMTLNLAMSALAGVRGREHDAAAGDATTAKNIVAESLKMHASDANYMGEKGDGRKAGEGGYVNLGASVGQGRRPSSASAGSLEAEQATVEESSTSVVESLRGASSGSKTAVSNLESKFGLNERYTMASGTDECEGGNRGGYEEAARRALIRENASNPSYRPSSTDVANRAQSYCEDIQLLQRDEEFAMKREGIKSNTDTILDSAHSEQERARGEIEQQSLFSALEAVKAGVGAGIAKMQADSLRNLAATLKPDPVAGDVINIGDDQPGPDPTQDNVGNPITGGDEVSDATADEPDEENPYNTDLGPGFEMPGDGTVAGGPAPAALSRGGDGGGAAGAPMGGAAPLSTSPDREDTNTDKQAAYAGLSDQGGSYRGGGGYVGGAGAKGKSGGSGLDLNSMLAKFLPELGGKDAGKDGFKNILDYGAQGGRGPSAWSPMDRNVNIFSRIESSYRRQEESGRLGL